MEERGGVCEGKTEIIQFEQQKENRFGGKNFTEPQGFAWLEKKWHLSHVVRVPGAEEEGQGWKCTQRSENTAK